MKGLRSILFVAVALLIGCLLYSDFALAQSDPSIVVATSFSGSDIGAQINNAMVSIPGGGIILIPQGSYTFSTTIQCPTAANATYTIIGTSRMSYTTGLGSSVTNAGGVTLNYNGNGVAIDQTLTSNAWEALQGCKFYDFSLVYTGTGSTATGIRFSGVQNFTVEDIEITGFYHGIAILNKSGMTTERYYIKHVLLENNEYGLYFYANSGGSLSFAFGDIDIDVLLRASSTARTAIFIDGDPGTDASLYDSTIVIRGNIIGASSTSTQSYIFEIGGNSGGSALSWDHITLRMECDGSSGTYCGRFYNNGTVSNDFLDESLFPASGTWSDGGNHTNSWVGTNTSTTDLCKTVSGTQTCL